MLFGNTARVQGSVPFGRKCVGVERNEGVFAAVLLQAVVESKEASQIGRVGDQGGPHCCHDQPCARCEVYPTMSSSPFFDSIGTEGVAAVPDMISAVVKEERGGKKYQCQCMCSNERSKTRIVSRSMLHNHVDISFLAGHQEQLRKFRRSVRSKREMQGPKRSKRRSRTSPSVSRTLVRLRWSFCSRAIDG